MGLLRGSAAAALVLATIGGDATAQAGGHGAPEPLGGVWEADRYLLAGGQTYDVEGRIFFGDRDWQVLFFVMDGQGEPQRGSAEGGGYVLRGDSLVLTHLYNLSVGDGMEGLPAQDLRMTVRAETEAVEEPTRIEVDARRLTLHFPSGNRMTFRRR